jgi:3-oxoisoapionate decarboxylase
MTRREVLAAAGCVPALLSRLEADTKNPHGKRGLGATPTGFAQRLRANSQAKPPVDFVDYCHNLGLGGIEMRLSSNDIEAARNFRQKLDSYDMHAILNIPLPKTSADLASFEVAVTAAKEAGAYGLHAAMTARRYEQFDSFQAFKADFERCQKTIALAEPVLRKHKLRLAIENHKGWRSAEQAAWMKRLGSEWVGVHLDFGNNMAFCEDPMQTLRTLQPYVFSCHIKDMAVEMYDEGFLLSEVPLGDGVLDLNSMVEVLRQKNPDVTFDLEMITRDPLKIPVFTDKYWVTFDDSDSPFPARDLARMLEFVKRHSPKRPLPRTSGLSAAEQLELEDENNLQSIAYARRHLDL